MARRRSGSPALPRLSPTRLNSYLTCPRQYYFGYIARLPRRARSYFSFGTSLHGALQEFHEQGGAETQQVGDLLGQLQTSWVDAGYASAEDQAARLELGQQMLVSYFEAETMRHAAEEKPAETLFVEKTLTAPANGYSLTGRIDRIDRRADGLLEVVDYKSGSYLPDAEELAEDLAIAIYQLLVARAFESPAVLGTIYNLKLNQGISLLRDEPALAQVADEVDQVFHTLSADTTYIPTPGPACRHCDYARYCPAAAI
jgi:putative RecB family exonuclease